ncbi:MAG: ROK family protein [Firmicutes bacterium]|nr:ROK family protein [Bacillota bacterium]
MQLSIANNASVKDQNLKVIVNLIRSNGPVSRAEISRQSGLSRSTVSELVGFLLRQGIVEEAGIGDSIGGRRPILLKIRARDRLIGAIHVDDDGCLYGRTEDLAGNASKTASAKSEMAEDLVATIDELLEILTDGDKTRLASLALALPGIISGEGGILSAVNLEWSNVPVVVPLQRQLGIPIRAENATGLAAYGEMSARDGDIHNLVYLRIGSVVGSGVVTNNQLHHGLRGSAAEIGHMVLDVGGEVCKCGRRGCLETKVSRRAALRLLAESEGSADQDRMDLYNVFEYLVNQDKLGCQTARGILIEIAGYTASAIVNVLNILGPDTVVVESALCDSHTFWSVLVERVAQEALPFAEGKYQVLPSLLGRQAVVIGAIAYATRLFYEHSQMSTMGI